MNNLFLVVLLGACIACAQSMSVPMRGGQVRGSAPTPVTSLPGMNWTVDYTMYSGYIPVAEKDYFYYFIQTDNSTNGNTDPVMLWLNGGPGCSSLGGMLSENGPFRPDGVQGLYPNDYAWNTLANMIYLESPAGVGFSLNPKNQNFNDLLTAEDNYAFLLGFFEAFPQFSTNEFWIAGESYGGHYVPQLSLQILENSNSSANATVLAKNFQGIMVGNPYTQENDNSIVQYAAYHGLTTLRGDSGNDYPNLDPYDILVDNDACSNVLLADYIRFPVHDILEKSLARYRTGGEHNMEKRYVPNPNPCINRYMSEYLNQASVKTAIHAQPNIHWALCGGPNYNGEVPDTVPLFDQIVTQYNRAVLVYSGDADTVCNFVGTETWVANLNYTQEAGWNPWYYSRPNLPKDQSEAQVGGFGINYKEGFTYVTVKGAGHMVPLFQPAPALEMFSSFLTNKKINFGSNDEEKTAFN